MGESELHQRSDNASPRLWFLPSLQCKKHYCNEL